MGTRLKNVAGLFANTRTRIILFFTIFVMVIALVAVYVEMRSRVTDDASASVTGVPGSIRSVPGSFDPTAQYAKLQNQENIQKADTALRTGGSAIPTIIREQRVTDQKTIAGGGVGFSALKRLGKGGTPKDLAFNDVKNTDCSPESIKKALAAGVTVSQLISTGCTAEQLKAAGLTASTLKAAGMDADDLKQICSAPELRKAGFSPDALRGAGYSACELKAAGYGAKQLARAGYTPDELKGAGFSTQAIQDAGARASGLPPGVTAAQLISADCDPKALARARQRGVSAKTLRRITGCSAAALKAAGYTAAELAKAGYSAAELRKAGFSADELRKAGFSAKDLAAAGFNADNLKKTGVSEADIKQAQAELAAQIPMSDDDVRKAGCSVKALKRLREQGVTATQIRKESGCSASALKAAGYTAAELKAAGFTAGELRRAGFSAAELKDAGFSAKQLKDAGFSAADLKNAGFSAQQLKDAGFNAQQLKAAGFSAGELKDAGFSATALKAAGFSSKQLKNAGFSATDLKNAGVSAAELKALGYSAKALKKAGFNRADLKKAGFSDAALKKVGLPDPTVTTDDDTDVDGKSAVPSIAGPATDDQRLQQALKQQKEQFNKQQLQQQIQTLAAAMQGQAAQVVTAWQAPSQGFVAGAVPVKTPEEAAAARAAAAAKAAEKGTVVAKAGDVVFAVLNTSVNSDEPGPILATVVSGRFKGARIIGSLAPTAEGQSLILTFTKMSLPEKENTISINAIAIDPKTARTGLASDVNNHYIERYGMLFVSSFLEGFSSAVKEAGATITQNTDGSFTASNVTLSGGEEVIVGLGKAGEKIGTASAKNINRRPTVKIYAGTGMGLMFVSDLTI